MDKNVINGRTLLADIMETDLTTILFKNWGRTVCQMHEHSNNDEYQDTNAPCALDHFFFSSHTPLYSEAWDLPIILFLM